LSALFMTFNQILASVFGDAVSRPALAVALLFQAAVFACAPEYAAGSHWVILSGISLGFGFGTTVFMLLINVANTVSREFRSTAVAYFTNASDMGIVWGACS